MPNLHPGTEHAVSIAGRSNTWYGQSVAQRITAGALAYRDDDWGWHPPPERHYSQLVCRHHQAMISGYSMQNEKTHHSKLHGRPWPSELPYDSTVPHRSKPHGRPWPS
jgi:hypothetical protein